MIGRAVILAAAGFLSIAKAAPPTAEWLFPVGGQRGTEVLAEMGGNMEPWPLKVWADHPGIRFAADEKKKGFFKIQLAADTPPGPHLVRFHNTNGVTTPRVFVVGTAPDVAEVEPNDAFLSPQTITNLPAVIHGKLGKSGDVDSYALQLKAGQTLVAAVDAFTVGSPTDALLILRDERGVKLAFNHDVHTLDPRLVWDCPRDGRYVLQIAGFQYPASSSVNFSGGGSHVYRLTVTQGAFITHTWPQGAQRGQAARLELRGWNLPADAFVNLPASAGESLLVPGNAVNAPRQVPVSDGVELTEVEPNDATNQVQTITLPAAVTGCIGRAGDVDRVAFHAKKGQALLLDLHSSRAGFILDGKLAIEDATGKMLISNDDSAGRKDPQLSWSAPADGVYQVVITDLFGHGGPEYVYRLSIAAPESDFSGSVTAPNFTIEPGKTNEVKVTVKTSGGFNGKLRLSAVGLPPGVTAAPIEMLKAGEAKLLLLAAPGAQLVGGEWRLELQAIEGGRTRAVFCDLTSAGSDNGVPQGFPDLIIRQTAQLWISIIAAGPPTPPAKKP